MLLLKGVMMLAIWILPYLVVTAIILWITIASVRKAMMSTGERTEISETIEDHPFTLNPIIWVILLATIFIGIVIVYYAVNFS